MSDLLLSKYDEYENMNPNSGIIFHWVLNSHLQPLIGKLLSKGSFFPSPVFHILLYRELSLPYCFTQGETLTYTYKLFADDLQQTKEEKEIVSHLKDYLHFEYELGFPWREAIAIFLPLISGEQFVIVKAEGGVCIVFEVFKSLSILARLKSKNIQRTINRWAQLFSFHMWM